MNNKQSISLFQFALILIHTKIGIGIITLANDVHKDAGTDGWISTLLAGLFIQIIIIIYGQLIKRYPADNLFEMTELILGKTLGKFVISLYLVNLFIVSAIMLTKYTVILKSWMMPLTPNWILFFFMIVVSVYVAKENLQVISRFFVLASSVIIIFIIAIMFAFKDINYTYILPIGTAGFPAILKGAVTSMSSFQGFEYILIFAPFVPVTSKQIMKTATITNVFVTLFYTFIVLMIEMYFSSEELKQIIEPIFYVVKSYTFTMIERPDLIFTSLWIVLVATSGVVLLYVTSIGLNHLFEVERRTLFVYVVAIISICISFFLYGEYRIDSFARRFHPVILFFSSALPFVLLMISMLRKQTGEKQ